MDTRRSTGSVTVFVQGENEWIGSTRRDRESGSIYRPVPESIEEVGMPELCLSSLFLQLPARDHFSSLLCFSSFRSIWTWDKRRREETVGKGRVDCRGLGDYYGWAEERRENEETLLQVNGIGFHPSYGTLVTIGSDGRYSMWDKVRECGE